MSALRFVVRLTFYALVVVGILGLLLVSAIEATP